MYFNKRAIATLKIELFPLNDIKNKAWNKIGCFFCLQLHSYLLHGLAIVSAGDLAIYINIRTLNSASVLRVSQADSLVIHISLAEAGL